MKPADRFAAFASAVRFGTNVEVDLAVAIRQGAVVDTTAAMLGAAGRQRSPARHRTRIVALMAQSPAFAAHWAAPGMHSLLLVILDALDGRPGAGRGVVISNALLATVVGRPVPDPVVVAQLVAAATDAGLIGPLVASAPPRHVYALGPVFRRAP